MPAENVAALRPKLEQAQKALEAALDEACETDVAGADTGDLMRLEESLSEARDAARNAISVLRRLHQEPNEGDEADPESHRSFIDEHGVHWQAFDVHPSRPTTGRTLPAPYHQGWLAMQCDNEIRRLAPIPEGWRKLSREELCQLLLTAPVSPRRRRDAEPRQVIPDSRNAPTQR